MNTPATDFEQQPATKRDVAEVKEELGEVKNELKQDIAHLEAKIDNGFEHIEDLLGGPRGLIVRVKRVEEAVGIQPDA